MPVLAVAALGATCVAGGALLCLGRREHRVALRNRAGLLDEAAQLLPNARVSLRPDGFPTLLAVLTEGEVALSLVVDTLVTRRLPQLWLMLTLREKQAVRDFSLGGLARPTGAEFYALTPSLPDWAAPPPGDVPVLLRAANLSPEAATRRAAELVSLLADPQLKEAAVTPRGVRVVRQVCQGDRSAHLLLRQARFAVEAVPAGLVALALADARRLCAALRSEEAILREAA